MFSLCLVGTVISKQIIHCLWFLQLLPTPLIHVYIALISLRHAGLAYMYVCVCKTTVIITVLTSRLLRCTLLTIKCMLYIFYISFPNYLISSYENRGLQTLDCDAGPHLSVLLVHSSTESFCDQKSTNSDLTVCNRS